MEKSTSEHFGPYEYTNQSSIGSMKLQISTGDTFEIKGFVRGISQTYGPFIFTNGSRVTIGSSEYKVIRGTAALKIKTEIKTKGLVKIGEKWGTPEEKMKVETLTSEANTGAPNIMAALSDFKIDSPLPGMRDFVFKVSVHNQDTKQNVVYVVVYGKNDMFSPPRRSAWPLAGDLFRQAGTRRGSLSPADITKDFASRSDAKGMKFVLKPNERSSCEAAFPINKTSQLEAWRGQHLDPRSIFNEIYLWLFSSDGQLVFQKQYNIK